MAQKLISMACPNCGGRVEVAPASRQFTCAFCGTTWSVKRTGLDGVPHVPVDRIASEYTIPRLEKEIDALIVSLLLESEDREHLRERLAVPAPRLIFGEMVQTMGFVLLTLALAWAVVGIRMAQTMSQPPSLVLLVALIPLPAVACIIAVGMKQSGMERERLRRIGQSKAQLRALYEQSRARSGQFEQVLQDKREQLERHKLLTSI